jgi:hypothetical protein
MEIIGEHVELKPEPPAKKIFLDPGRWPGKAFEIRLTDEDFDKIWPGYRQEAKEGRWWFLVKIPQNVNAECLISEFFGDCPRYSPSSVSLGDRKSCLQAIISAGMADELVEV